MPKRSSIRKPKEDFSQAAFRIVQELTSEKPKANADISAALDNDSVRKQVMREMGSRGGKKGGLARAAKLSTEERVSIARAAASKRWGKSAPQPEKGD